MESSERPDCLNRPLAGSHAYTSHNVTAPAVYVVPCEVEADGRAVAATQMVCLAAAQKGCCMQRCRLGHAPARCAGRRALHRVEFRFVVEGARRRSEGGLAGRAEKLSDLDSAEFTPLPAGPAPSAPAMS
jgi:hypothetical protein